MDCDCEKKYQCGWEPKKQIRGARSIFLIERLRDSWHPGLLVSHAQDLSNILLVERAMTPLDRKWVGWDGQSL